MSPLLARFARVLPVLVVLALLPTASAAALSSPRPASSLPKITHVFVINIENESFTKTWGADSAAPYLATTLRAQGVLLTKYYGIGHHSLDNYVAQVSGQGPNPSTQQDCKTYTAFHTKRVDAHGQRVGTGCVYDKSTPTLMKQLDAASLTWRGYMDDMPAACTHPKLGAKDNHFKETATDAYATRHDPFVYFRSVTSRSSYCSSHVVKLSHLTTDLESTSTTRNLSYITPDLCNDGHDAPCADGEPGGLVSVNTWMQTWVPRILDSPAFKAGGMLVITADEADDAAKNDSACCGEGADPNTAHPGITGPGGGRIGALVISSRTAPDTTSTTPYNHYGLLASIEKTFGLSRIGYADLKKVHAFGSDVYNAS